MTIIQHSVSGKYKLEAVNKFTGKTRLLAEWFPNLILNAGLDRMAVNSSYMDYCQVGSGSATPAVTDTTLSSFRASTNTKISDTSGANSVSPYYAWRKVKYRFGAGAASGNIAEVAVGWSATSGSLYSRALILDGLGSPTTITVLGDEYLDVTYELHVYPNESDVVGSAVISGTTYTTTTRPANCGSSGYWKASGQLLAINSAVSAFSGALGPITGVPSGTEDADGISANNTYVTGTFERVGTVTFSIGDANFGAGGIQSVVFGGGSLSASRYQVEFSPAIPKVATQELILNVKVALVRR